LAVTAALAALIMFIVPLFIDRHDYTVAVDNYARNPTLNNRETVVQEYAKTRRLAAFIGLGTWGALFVVMNLGWLVVTRMGPGRGRRLSGRVADALESETSNSRDCDI
jgi:hypothetical protein